MMNNGQQPDTGHIPMTYGQQKDLLNTFEHSLDGVRIVKVHFY
jgi:hypothetical protein